MNKSLTYLQQWRQISPEDKYPLVVRIFAVLSILGAEVQLLVFALSFFNLLRTGIDFSALEGRSVVLVVISVIELVLSVALTVMFLVLGIRLLLNKRHESALLCNVMIALESGVITCQIMSTGSGVNGISALVNIGILVALQAYSDPSLQSERRLQRKLQQLEDKAAAEDGTLGRDTTGKGFITLNFFNVFWVFVVTSVLGLLLELLWHMVVVDPGVYQDRAGLLYGPFSPIYGVGAVLLTTVLNRFYKSNAFVIFLVSALIGGGFEFAASWFFEFAFGLKAWDYSGTFLSIDGRTNGQFMAMWGMLGLLWIKALLPRVLKLVNRIPWNWRYALTSVCAGLMVVDIVFTLSAFDSWYMREAGKMDYENAQGIVAFCNEHYPDAFMANRFQTMTIDPSMATRG